MSVLRWAEIAPTLVHTVGMLALDDDELLERPADASWDERGSGFVSPETLTNVTIRATGMRQIGEDARYLDDGTSQKISWHIITLQVVCEVDENTDTNNALIRVSNIHTRLARDSVSEKFRSLGIGITNTGDITSVQFKNDGREIDIKTFNFEISIALVDEDRSTAGSYIASIGAVSTLRNAMGPLPVKLQYIETVGP